MLPNIKGVLAISLPLCVITHQHGILVEYGYNVDKKAFASFRTRPVMFKGILGTSQYDLCMLKSNLLSLPIFDHFLLKGPEDEQMVEQALQNLSSLKKMLHMPQNVNAVLDFPAENNYQMKVNYIYIYITIYI